MKKEEEEQKKKKKKIKVEQEKCQKDDRKELLVQCLPISIHKHIYHDAWVPDTQGLVYIRSTF